MEYLVMNGELYHHGIKGQKWGVRRWQNADGTYNEAGKKRYFADSVQTYNKAYNKANRTQEAADKAEREMKDAYKALGKNKVSRTINAIKGSRGKGGEAYDRYSKAYDKANKTQEAADKAEREMKEAYKNTGKNSVSRVVNNIKYDPKRMEKLASKDAYRSKVKDINSRRDEVNRKYDKKNADDIWGFDNGGIKDRVKSHIKNEYDRSKALNKLDQERLNAKREYRTNIGKKKVDTLMMKLGQNEINAISDQTMSEFTRDYVKSIATEAYDMIKSRRD